jgi:hypothetical protein
MADEPVAERPFDGYWRERQCKTVRLTSDEIEDISALLGALSPNNPPRTLEDFRLFGALRALNEESPTWRRR